MTLLAFWPHLLGILAAAALAVRAPRPARAMLASLALAVLVAAAYLLLQNGVAPPPSSGRPGQYAALFVACALPLAAAGAVGHALVRRALSAPVSVAAAALAGLVLLTAMPFVQLALGCLMSDVCL